MNFVVIEGTVSSVRRQLESDKRMIQKVFMETENPEYESKIKLIDGKLRAIANHESLQSKRTSFEKTLHLKYKNPDLYMKRCKSLCKDIKGVSFAVRDGLFVVRPTIDKKRTYIGSFDHLDDALEAMEMYRINLDLVNR